MCWLIVPSLVIITDLMVITLSAVLYTVSMFYHLVCVILIITHEIFSMLLYVMSALPLPPEFNCLLFCLCTPQHAFLKWFILSYPLHISPHAGNCLVWCADLQYLHLLSLLCVFSVCFALFLSVFESACEIFAYILKSQAFYICCLWPLCLYPFTPHQCLFTCDFTSVLILGLFHLC